MKSERLRALKQQMGLVPGTQVGKLQSRMDNPGVRKGTAKSKADVFSVTGRKKYNPTFMKHGSDRNTKTGF